MSISLGSRYSVSLNPSYDSLDLDTLIERQIIEREKLIVCDTHGIYTAKPLTKFQNNVIYTECPQCAKERKEEQQKEIEKQNQAFEKARLEREENLLISRGCGKKYLKMRGSFLLDTELMSKGLEEYLKVDDNGFVNQGNLIVLGGVGIGKTFFANALVDKAYQIGLNYILLNSFEIASLYKSKNIGGFNRTNSFENIAEALYGVDCVILDEVDYFLRGSKDIRDDEALHHFSQICERDDIRVIILGNCNKKELKEGLPPKVYSRFRGGNVINGWEMRDMREDRAYEK